MKKELKRISTGLAGSLLIAAAAMATGSIRNEPVVMYDISGYGIAGPIHHHLAVYNSGMCSMSSLAISQTRSEFTTVSSSRVRSLVKTLVDYGAMTQGDLPQGGADIPLHTLTVFDGGDEGAANNSFSFYAATDSDVEEIVEILDGFIFEVFGEVGTPVVESPLDPPQRRWREPLRYSQRVYLSEVGLGLAFVDVPSDTRCLAVVPCSGPDQVEIVLNIWFQGEDMGEYHLFHGRDVGGFMTIEGLEIRVLGVRPAPSFDPIPLEDYKILLQISEL